MRPIKILLFGLAVIMAFEFTIPYPKPSRTDDLLAKEIINGTFMKGVANDIRSNKAPFSRYGFDEIDDIGKADLYHLTNGTIEDLSTIEKIKEFAFAPVYARAEESCEPIQKLLPINDFTYLRTLNFPYSTQEDVFKLNYTTNGNVPFDNLGYYDDGNKQGLLIAHSYIRPYEVRVWNNLNMYYVPEAIKVWFFNAETEQAEYIGEVYDRERGRGADGTDKIFHYDPTTKKSYMIVGAGKLYHTIRMEYDIEWEGRRIDAIDIGGHPDNWNKARIYEIDVPSKNIIFRGDFETIYLTPQSEIDKYGLDKPREQGIFSLSFVQRIDRTTKEPVFFISNDRQYHERREGLLPEYYYGVSQIVALKRDGSGNFIEIGREEEYLTTSHIFPSASNSVYTIPYRPLFWSHDTANTVFYVDNGVLKKEKSKNLIDFAHNRTKWGYIFRGNYGYYTNWYRLTDEPREYKNIEWSTNYRLTNGGLHYMWSSWLDMCLARGRPRTGLNAQGDEEISEQITLSNRYFDNAVHLQGETIAYTFDYSDWHSTGYKAERMAIFRRLGKAIGVGYDFMHIFNIKK